MQDREILSGLIRLHILHHASNESVYGLGMIKERRHHGYELSPGTLYPILRRLEENGYLASSRELVGGKNRKIYRTTTTGDAALKNGKARVKELFEEK
jgi:DNA-binding PadR family transcriptional regulator